MAENYGYVEDVVSDDGYVTRSGYTRWDCVACGREVRRYPFESDVDCRCGACYNASGQRLRDDWRGNPSCYDDDVSDLEGYELQHSGDE